MDKYIDLDKEDKIDPNSPKKQELLQRKETEKGSFFGVMLEGRTNTFLDANPKAAQMIDKLKSENASLLETISKLEQRIENILEIREQENEVKRHLELLVEESRNEIAHFLGQIKILKDEKDEQAEKEKEFSNLKEEIKVKDVEIAKILDEGRRETKNNVEEVNKLKKILTEDTEKFKKFEQDLKERDMLRNKVKELQVYKDQQSDYEFFKEKLHEKNEEFTALETLFGQLEEELSNMANDIKNEQNKNVELQEQLGHRESELEKKIIQVEDLEKQLVQREEQAAKELDWAKKKNALKGFMSPKQSSEHGDKNDDVIDDNDHYEVDLDSVSSKEKEDELNIGNPFELDPITPKEDDEPVKLTLSPKREKSIDEWKFSFKMQELRVDALEKDKKALIKQIKLLGSKGEGGRSAREKLEKDELNKKNKELEDKHLAQAKAIQEEIKNVFNIEISTDKPISQMFVELKENQEEIIKQKQVENDIKLKEVIIPELEVTIKEKLTPEIETNLRHTLEPEIESKLKEKLIPEFETKIKEQLEKETKVIGAKHKVHLEEIEQKNNVEIQEIETKHKVQIEEIVTKHKVEIEEIEVKTKAKIEELETNQKILIEKTHEDEESVKKLEILKKESDSKYQEFETKLTKEIESKQAQILEKESQIKDLETKEQSAVLLTKTTEAKFKELELKLSKELEDKQNEVLGKEAQIKELLVKQEIQVKESNVKEEKEIETLKVTLEVEAKKELEKKIETEKAKAIELLKQKEVETEIKLKEQLEILTKKETEKIKQVETKITIEIGEKQKIITEQKVKEVEVKFTEEIKKNQATIEEKVNEIKKTTKLLVEKTQEFEKMKGEKEKMKSQNFSLQNSVHSLRTQNEQSKANVEKIENMFQAKKRELELSIDTLKNKLHEAESNAPAAMIPTINVKFYFIIILTTHFRLKKTTLPPKRTTAVYTWKRKMTKTLKKLTRKAKPKLQNQIKQSKNKALMT